MVACIIGCEENSQNVSCWMGVYLAEKKIHKTFLVGWLYIWLRGKFTKGVRDSPGYAGALWFGQPVVLTVVPRWTPLTLVFRCQPRQVVERRWWTLVLEGICCSVRTVVTARTCVVDQAGDRRDAIVTVVPC